MMTSNYNMPYGRPPASALQPVGNSKLGIASFAIGIAVILLVVVSAGVIGVAAVSAARQRAQPEPPTAYDPDSLESGQPPARPKPIVLDPGTMMLAGAASCFAALLALVGAILGAVSLSQPGRRVFPILGLVINGGFLLLVGLSTLARMASRH